MYRKIITFISTLFLSVSAWSITLPEAKIVEMVVYIDEGGRTIIGTDLPANQYNGPNCNDKYWYQLAGNAPEKLYSAVLAAYHSGSKVRIGVHDTVCTSNGRPQLLFIKMIK